jgi:hypothetical protein
MRMDECLQRLCFSEPIYIDGKLQKKLVTKQDFKCNVQPILGRDLLLVPEHQRFEEQYWCFVPENFFDKSGEKTGDVVLRNCIHYQVQAIEYWGSYQKARIMRVDVGEYANP